MADIFVIEEGRMQRKQEHEKIRSAIQVKYAVISQGAVGKFAYSTGAEGAKALGYDEAVFAEMPDELMQSFCGVGNPFQAGPINAGESLLDVGCGAGVDLIVASRYVGEQGRICGIDMTPEMCAVAKQNISALGLENVEIREGNVESIPYPDNSFDMVISNGVLNLSPRKARAFSEIFRVLVPGGRLQFADIVFEGETARKTPCTLASWSD